MAGGSGAVFCRLQAGSASIAGDPEMTETQAEEIIMAVEVDMFHGSRLEYAEALLLIAARDQQEQNTKVRV